MRTDYYGVWRSKDGSEYLAHDIGDTFVKDFNRFNSADRHRLADLANDGLRLRRDPSLRARLARRLLRIEASDG